MFTQKIQIKMKESDVNCAHISSVEEYAIEIVKNRDFLNVMCLTLTNKNSC